MSVILPAVLLLGAGLWALDLQARQARDVRRKLDLEDLETALRRSLALEGTLPPRGQTTWCGRLTAPEQQAVRAEVERSLRETTKYAKLEKPFPADPRFGGTARDYLYVKTSPVSFQLLAELEADETNDRTVPECGTDLAYDYAIHSLARNPL